MSNRHFRIALLIIVLLLVNHFLFFYFSDESFAQGSIPEWLDESAEEVEILILLNDQANTGMVAFWTRRSLPFFLEPKLIQKEVRSEVVEALQKKADSSQGALIEYLDQEMAAGNVIDHQSYYIINLIYARVVPDLVEAIMQRPDVDSVWPNEEVEFGLSQHSTITGGSHSIPWNISHIGADAVWNSLGYDGSGVVIGFIDTGVYLEHESLLTKYRGYNPENPDNPNHSYNWFDPYHGRMSPDDLYGHGTTVTSIALGSDPEKKNQIGVAPGAQWIAARGMNDSGFGTYAVLLEAMEFMLAPSPNANGSGEPNSDMAPDIVSNSWGGQVACVTVFKQAILNWRSAGIFPVFSAGNLGPSAGSIRLPANYRESFAVGAVDEYNNLPSFSSRGPGACGSFIKPDLVAPGVSIRVADNNGGYAYWSGTSMAAPHVAGVAALLRSVDPSLTVNQLEQILLNTARPLTSNIYPNSPNHGFGYGLVDAFSAINEISMEQFKVVLDSSPASGGILTGSGSYESGFEVTVEANPYPGYNFLSWKENEQVVSENASYTFSISSDRHLTAYFSRNNYTISVAAEPAEGGEVTGEGHYYHGNDVRLVAAAGQGYRFSGWEENGVISFREAIYYFVAESDRSFVARFQEVTLNSIVPSFIYYENAGGFLVRADFRKAVDDYLSGNKALYEAINKAFIASRLSDRAIYVEDGEGFVVDYKKALDNGIPYFEAALNPAVFGTDQLNPDKELIIDPIRGLSLEIDI